MSVNRAALPTTLYTAEQTRLLDKTAIEEFGIPGIKLMQRAGHAVFAEILERYPQLGRLTIFAGAGNNGGDGFVIAHLARQKKIDVQLICLGDDDFPNKLQGEAKQAWELLQLFDGSFECYEPGAEVVGDIIVDAMLGTGLAGDVRGKFKQAIEQINSASKKVVAVDIPSGLCADTGRVLGCAVEADLTVSFIGLKQGLLTGEAVNHTGTVLFDDLKVPPEVYDSVDAEVIRTSKSHLHQLLPRRERSAHKGHFGHVLVVGGNHGMGGAALLASEAAIRSGAGLVSLATRPEHVAASLTRCPEVMCHGVETVAALKPLIFKADVIVIGPGLGQDAWAEQMLREVLSSDKARVIDADALNIITEKQLFESDVKQPQICTPHPGEAARVLAEVVSELMADRFAAVKNLQKSLGGTVVLKGAGTVSTAGEKIYLCNKGNPGMAVGGMGDVLSGICGAFIAQGLSAEDAARAAVYAHASAADLITSSQGEVGLLATNVSKVIPRVINSRDE